ncbi:MAG TPA: N-acetylmuramoyl-L-alanine amidase, partial [Bacillota bacterium]|nr:N-acetylmuramoyl-L-alanine amidase [Bacillota bacterium]
VIRYDSINAPAALIEMGFISNDAEANRLARSDYQKLLAEGMAEGFVEHAKQYKKEDGVIKRRDTLRSYCA